MKPVAKMQPKRRKQVIKNAAMQLIREEGLAKLTFDKISEYCCKDWATACSPRTIRHHYRTLDDVFEAVQSQIESDKDLWAQAIKLGYVADS